MYTQLKRTGRWIPLSAKTLAYYKNKYPKCTYINEILSCIEDIFLSKKRYFIKDVLKYIKEGNFIPHLNMNDICNYTSFNHAFRDKYPMNKNWNKNDINVLYITYKLKKYVTNKNILYNIIRDYYNTDKTGLNNLTLKYINARKKVLKKLYCFYINDNFMNDYFQFEYGGYIDDYIELCFRENEKIKFKKSIKKIVEEHDKIVEKALKNKRRGKKKVIVKNNSKFNDLRKLLPDEFEWLKDSKRLELETYIIETYYIRE